MKKFSIILNVVLLLVSLFFVVYARLQANEAEKAVLMAVEFQNDVNILQDEAEQEAVNAREAEAKTLELLVQLEACQQGK